MSKRMNVILVVIASAFAMLSLGLGLALHDAQKEHQDAIHDAAHWKSVASKLYKGYLLATSPASEDGLIHQMVIPKGSIYQDGELLPPDNFCETGLLQCKWNPKWDSAQSTN